jgi:hypothetical protein
LFRGQRFPELDVLNRCLQFRIVRIDPVVARLLVAVAVICQVDVDKTLRGESRGLALRVSPHLFAEDDAGDAAVFAGDFPIGPGYQAAEENPVLSRHVLEFLNGPLELVGGLLPAGPFRAAFGDSFEQVLFVGRGRRGINRPGALDRRLALPAVGVVVADHGDCPQPVSENPARSESVYISETRDGGREFAKSGKMSKVDCGPTLARSVREGWCLSSLTLRVGIIPR